MSSGQGNYTTDQEAFWAGDFGTEYSTRNQGAALLASNLTFMARALSTAQELSSCIEFGANIGMNLQALRLLYPAMSLHGIEINADAARELAKLIGKDNVIEGSIFDARPPVCDLALIKGVLIHINPEFLPQVYDKLCAATRRWLLVAEYYNPSPVSVPYRNHADKLFKRDFAGEIMDRHPEFRLVDYGFAYRRDPVSPQDDITWFLMEKK